MKQPALTAWGGSSQSRAEVNSRLEGGENHFVSCAASVDDTEVVRFSTMLGAAVVLRHRPNVFFYFMRQESSVVGCLP